MYRPSELLGRLLSRGLVQAIKYSGGIQFARVSLLANEVRDDVERLETYGHTSNPPKGTEFVAAFIGGDRSHGVILGEINDSADRPTLSAGESAMWASGGAQMQAQLAGKVAIGTSSVELLEQITQALNLIATGTVPSGGGTLSTAAAIQTVKGLINTIKGTL